MAKQELSPMEIFGIKVGAVVIGLSVAYSEFQRLPEIAKILLIVIVLCASIVYFVEFSAHFTHEDGGGIAASTWPRRRKVSFLNPITWIFTFGLLWSTWCIIWGVVYSLRQPLDDILGLGLVLVTVLILASGRPLRLRPSASRHHIFIWGRSATSTAGGFEQRDLGSFNDRLAAEVMVRGADSLAAQAKAGEAWAERAMEKSDTSGADPDPSSKKE